MKECLFQGLLNICDPDRGAQQMDSASFTEQTTSCFKLKSWNSFVSFNLFYHLIDFINKDFPLSILFNFKFNQYSQCFT